MRYCGAIKAAFWQAVDEKLAGTTEKGDGLRFCQSTSKNGLDRFYCRKGFLGKEVVKCLTFKGTEIAAGEMLRWRVLSGKVTR